MKKALYLFLSLFIIVFFVAPQLQLFAIPRLANYSAVFKNENTLKAIFNTLLLSTCVGFCCLLLGVPLSWLFSRTNLPFKQHFRSIFCLPYVIPPFVGAIGWIILANPTSGVIKQWLGINLNIYSFFGLVWVETTFLFSIVLLSSLKIFDQMDSSLEEAARLSGASSKRVFWDISFPILRPALISGFIFTFLATASSFGVPALIGGPARIYLLTTQIYTFQRMGTENGTQMAIAVSALLGFITLVLVYGSQSFAGLQKNFMVGGKTARPSLLQLNKMKAPLVIFLILLFTMIFLLPIFGVALSAFSTVQGSWSFSNLGISNFYRVLFETTETPRAIIQSLSLGFTTAAFCVLFAFVYNYYLHRTQYWGRRAFHVAVSLPFSIPGTVLALALIISFSKGLFGFGPSLYNTLLLMMIAYVLKYSNLSMKVLNEGYEQIHPSLEEAAQLSGARWPTLMHTIYRPLLQPALWAAFFLVLMPTLSELTMSVLLTGPGLETIGTLIFQLQEYSDVGGGGSAVLSFIVVVFTLVLNYSLKFITKNRYGL